MTKNPHIVAIDLDGTLCNSSHREHYARAGDWDQFHSHLMDDEPWPDVKQFCHLMDLTNNITVGLTARPERYRIVTQNWLALHDIGLDCLLMRPNDDYRKSEELKPAMLDAWLDGADWGHDDVWFILEDRDKVAEQWRNLGHNCWQVRAGGY